MGGSTVHIKDLLIIMGCANIKNAFTARAKKKGGGSFRQLHWTIPPQEIGYSLSSTWTALLTKLFQIT